jgi:hypothetical protein
MCRTIALLFKHFGVIHVITAQSVAPRRTIMKTFTIDDDNNITAHPFKKAARDTGAGIFASEEQFADVIGPDNKRLVEIWNSLPGVKPVAKFANRKVATERIWKAIQDLGEVPSAAPASEPPDGAIEAETAVAEVAPAEPAQTEPPATPETTSEPSAVAVVDQPADAADAAEPAATVGAQAPDVAPAAGEPSKETTSVKKAPKTKKAAKAQESTGPREGSKTAQVVAMLQRKNGATLAEIMEKMGWQKHTVRGFMAGAMKKAGYTVESFKEGGERSYRINP